MTDFSELTQKALQTEELPYAPWHVRVLHTPTDGSEQSYGLTFIVWEDIAPATKLHQLALSAVEGSMLVELCGIPLDAEQRGKLAFLRVVAFHALPHAANALRAFGLHEIKELESLAGYKESLRRVRGEAQLVEFGGGDVPTSVWQVDAKHLPEDGWSQLDQAFSSAQCWGARPGEYFSILSQWCMQHHEFELEPTGESLARVSNLLVALQPGVLRMMPQGAFLALCDMVGVVAAQEHGRKVQWAHCEPDESGIMPPPLLRVTLDDGPSHIPVGKHLMRWCVMPLQPDENPAPLSEWVLDQFARSVTS